MTKKTKSKKPEERILAERYASLDELREDPDNPNQHDDRNLEAIKQSLLRFGQVEPLVVQVGTGIVVGGNGRLRALREMGHTEALVKELVLDDRERKALGVALNRLPRLSHFDEGVLAEILVELQESDLLAPAGFTEEELQDLLSDVEPPEFKEYDDQMPVTGAEDPTKLRCPKCGHAFHPDEKNKTTKGRKEREAERKTRGKKA